VRAATSGGGRAGSAASAGACAACRSSRSRGRQDLCLPSFVPATRSSGSCARGARRRGRCSRASCWAGGASLRSVASTRTSPGQALRTWSQSREPTSPSSRRPSPSCSSVSRPAPPGVSWPSPPQALPTSCSAGCLPRRCGRGSCRSRREARWWRGVGTMRCRQSRLRGWACVLSIREQPVSWIRSIGIVRVRHQRFRGLRILCARVPPLGHSPPTSSGAGPQTGGGHGG